MHELIDLVSTKGGGANSNRRYFRVRTEPVRTLRERQKTVKEVKESHQKIKTKVPQPQPSQPRLSRGNIYAYKKCYHVFSCEDCTVYFTQLEELIDHFERGQHLLCRPMGSLSCRRKQRQKKREGFWPQLEDLEKSATLLIPFDRRAEYSCNICYIRYRQFEEMDKHLLSSHQLYTENLEQVQIHESIESNADSLIFTSSNLNPIDKEKKDPHFARPILLDHAEGTEKKLLNHSNDIALTASNDERDVNINAEVCGSKGSMAQQSPTGNRVAMTESTAMKCAQEAVGESILSKEDVMILDSSEEDEFIIMKLANTEQSSDSDEIDLVKILQNSLEQEEEKENAKPMLSPGCLGNSPMTPTKQKMDSVLNKISNSKSAGNAFSDTLDPNPPLNVSSDTHTDLQATSPEKSVSEIECASSSSSICCEEKQYTSTLVNRNDNSMTDDTLSESSRPNSKRSHHFANAKPTTESSPKKPFKCLSCPASFTRRSRLNCHSLLHTGEKPHVCHMCDMKFRLRMRLNEHLLRHKKEKPFTCDQCGLAMATSSDLRLHMRHHLDDRRHKCKQCEKAFVRNSDLKIHLRIHTGEKPFTCKMCNKSFAAKQNLSAHLHTHVKDKTFKCELCEKSFLRKADIRVHMRHHTGEKPYKCTLCDKSFSSRLNARLHEERVHKKSDGLHPNINDQFIDSGVSTNGGSPGLDHSETDTNTA